MNQIAHELNISESGVSYWLNKMDIKRRSISDAVTNIYITKFHKKQFKIKENLSPNEEKLKIAGAMLYWGEGAKTGGTVKFANSDPEMIELFLIFLRKICGISESRLRGLIHIYPDHDYIKIKNFWGKKTKLSKNQFYKQAIHSGRLGTYKKKSEYGTITINYSDTKLLKIILEWIEEYKKENIK